MLKTKAACFLFMLLLLGSADVLITEAQESEYVTQREFIKQLVTTVGVQGAHTEEAVHLSSHSYIQAARRLKIVTEAKEESFVPSKPITREQAYVFFIRSLNLAHSYDLNVLNTLKDGHTLTWSKKEIAAAVQLKLLPIQKGGKINPKQLVSVQELAGMLKRYKEHFIQVPILYTNDIHGRIMYDERKGELGYGKIAHIVEEVRRQYPNTLLLDMGDAFHGTNLVNLTKGEVVADIMNKLNYDAMTVGNHDFNYGEAHLTALASKVQFPIVSANIMKDGQVFFKPYVIKEVNGKKIALIGLTAAETAVKTNPEGIKGITFKDEFQVIKEMVKKLREKADYIVVLSHCGLEVDQTIATEIAGVDLILGGHSHNTMERPQKLDYAYVTQAFEHGKALGRANLLFHENKLIGINGFLYRDDRFKGENAAIGAFIEPYKQKADKLLNEVIGEVDVKLDGERMHVRTKETNLGNLIADAMRHAANTDIAITNGGGIRSSIDEGKVTRDELLTVLPFTDTLVKMTLTGREIKRVLEHSISKYPKEHGGFLQVSGLTFTFNPLQRPGNRVAHVEIKGEALQPAKRYTVAVNRFTCIGGDGYTMLKKQKINDTTGQTLAKVVANYIKKRPIIPRIEGRITQLNED